MTTHDLEFQYDTEGGAALSDPLIIWASGLPTSDRRIYAGWMIDQEVDSELDAAMQRAKVESIGIKHGSGNTVHHWCMPEIDIFPIATGVPRTVRDAAPQPTGLVYAWTVRDDGRNQSVLRLRVLVRQLVAVGYMQPLTLILKGTVTKDIMTVLYAQYKVRDAYRKLKGGDARVPFYAFAIGLGVGAEVTRGTGTNKKTFSVPKGSIPDAITEAYLRERWIGRKEIVEAIEDRIEETRIWAADQYAALTSAAPDAQPEPAPASAPSARNIPSVLTDEEMAELDKISPF